MLPDMSRPNEPMIKRTEQVADVRMDGAAHPAPFHPHRTVILLPRPQGPFTVRHVSSELAEDVRATAEAAVEALAEQYGDALDYSVPSLVLVDEVLDTYGEYLTDAPEQAVRNFVQMVGCYVLEVGRREFGGTYQWWDERQAPVLVVGEPDFHVSLLASDKVTGRLHGDKSDSIPFLYDGFAERVSTATAGTSVTFV
jgi:hypothetical protein